MGMCAAAIPVMPLGQGLATLIRKRLYTEQERETGLASLFMGCFGISEGAIPFAAARPRRSSPPTCWAARSPVRSPGSPASRTRCRTAGPIVAVLGAVSGVPMFFVAVVIGLGRHCADHGAPSSTWPSAGGAGRRASRWAWVRVRLCWWGPGSGLRMPGPWCCWTGREPVPPSSVGVPEQPARPSPPTPVWRATMPKGLTRPRRSNRLTRPKPTTTRATPLRLSHRADREGSARCRRQGGRDP
ncbi:hypothetical protein SCANM63S_03629 [Streptomyces canarius]